MGKSGYWGSRLFVSLMLLIPAVGTASGIDAPFEFLDSRETADQNLCPPFELRCQMLMTSSSDFPAGYHGLLQVRRDQGRVVGMDYRDNFDGRDITPGMWNYRTFTIERLREGGVLIQALGMEMLSLQAPDFDPISGGRVRLDVKPSALAARRPVYFQYKNQTMELLLETEAGLRPVDGMRVTVSRVGGAPTGVKSVDFFRLGRSIHTMRF